MIRIIQITALSIARAFASRTTQTEQRNVKGEDRYKDENQPSPARPASSTCGARGGFWRGLTATGLCQQDATNEEHCKGC